MLVLMDQAPVLNNYWRSMCRPHQRCRNSNMSRSSLDEEVTGRKSRL